MYVQHGENFSIMKVESRLFGRKPYRICRTNVVAKKDDCYYLNGTA